MCGRFSFTKTKEQVKERFNLKKLPGDIPELYNIAPQQNVPVILNDSPDGLSWVRWGLVPHWSREEKFKLNLINAKAETIAEKPIFKSLVKSKRCLILADGFYEWKKVDGKKAPYRIMMKDDGMFSFAGIWDSWGDGEKQLKTCCIITTSPNKLVSEIHDRMPVILTQDKEELWLDKGDVDLLRSFNAGEMKVYPISKGINNPGNNSPNLVESIS